MAQSTEAATVAMLMFDPCNARRLSACMRSVGLNVQQAHDILGLMCLLERQGADIAVVEDRSLDMPSCLGTLRFRGLGSVPIVAIGAGSIQEIVSALTGGASDYLCASDADEAIANRVLARILLSRREEDRGTLQFDQLMLDARSRTLRGPVDVMTLTAREFELAWVLFEHAGEVVNLHVLSNRVWGREVSLAKRTIEQHVSRLRQKLTLVGGGVDATFQLLAINNIGYRLVHVSAPCTPCIAHGKRIGDLGWTVSPGRITPMDRSASFDQPRQPRSATQSHLVVDSSSLALLEAG